MHAKSIILPTTRSIRSRVLTSSSSFLPNFITMGEFLQKALLVPKLRLIDEDTRTLLLLEAADFKNFQKLQIERNFFTFTKNSSYIFGFFEELEAERVSLESIAALDLYGEYEEHMQILQELKKRYEQLCIERGFYDKIMLPRLASLQHSYVESLGEIEVEVSGMLTNFELEVLTEAAEHTKVVLHFEADAYNLKMQKRLQTVGFELEKGYGYLLDLSTKEIIKKEPLQSNDSIEAYAVSQKLLEVALIKAKVAEYVQKGYDPSKIAVVLPNETTKDFLKIFDTKRNFNFAMGESLRQSGLFQKLRATLEAIEEMSVQNEAYLERMGDELYLELFGIYNKPLGELDIEKILERLLDLCETKEEQRAIKEESYRFIKLLPYMQELTLKAALKIFTSRLAQRSVDDVGGGKITVMGVLETRSMEFDAVIVPDFNDSNIPKRVEKDMFLNSVIRQKAALPTRKDREELQKHYYEALFRKSKEVCVIYVESETDMPSKFLKELGIRNVLHVDESKLSSKLFSSSAALGEKRVKSFSVPYDFTKSRLSNAKLSTYLTCTQKFFFRYIAKISSFEIPKDVPNEWEIGRVLHVALKNLYMQNRFFENEKELCDALKKELEEARGESELEKFQVALYAKMLQPFCKSEIERFKEGYRVFKVEQECTRKWGKLELYGVIDRIDTTPAHSLEVLDYKSGTLKTYTAKNVEEATDFQLEFYYLLAQTYGDVDGAAFYELKSGKIVSEPFLQEKLELLQKHLQSLEQLETIEIRQCEDLTLCKRCEYNIMCGRE